MDWHPTLKQLYFSENARDWLSEDMPEDKLNRVTQPGKDNFGYPYCHQGNFTDPEFGWGRSCDEFTKPVALVGPHSAALGLKFYTGEGLGNEYRNALFLARHGSWNRSVKIGGDVVTIRLNDDGTFRSMEPFITGFIQNNNYVGRPVDVLPMKDGSLLVSDDFNGAVYRVSRAGAAARNEGSGAASPRRPDPALRLVAAAWAESIDRAPVRRASRVTATRGNRSIRMCHRSARKRRPTSSSSSTCSAKSCAASSS